jgi:DNA (cytosine-5)-methyltransferase 1
MMAEENKGKKKKFKEGQAEQVLDDLFFEAIKGVEILKPKVVINALCLFCGTPKSSENNFCEDTL